jgi:hypothetical protein
VKTIAVGVHGVGRRKRVMIFGVVKQGECDVPEVVYA